MGKGWNPRAFMGGQPAEPPGPGWAGDGSTPNTGSLGFKGVPMSEAASSSTFISEHGSEAWVALEAR